MTQEEIIEGNSLIAEFMGLKKEDQTGFSHPSNFRYHIEWDWLMPVGKRISTLKDFPRPLLNGIESVIPYIDSMRRMKKGVLNFDIDECYLGVIEFIKWYNINHSR